MPEIIGFSNDLCYGNRLIPMRETELRKSGRPFGPAIQTQFIDGGRSVGAKPVNEMEAEEIVHQVRFSLSCHHRPAPWICVLVLTLILSQVRAILEEDADLEDPKEKRSIGIISLWHVNQAKHIDALLVQDDYISQRREQHDIRCGDAREFQGDEKDIILLSLVIGGERRMPSDDRAAFNVAVSRARHSLILFHSVKPGDLKDGDIRKTLLEYCKAYWPDENSSFNSKQGQRRKDYALSLSLSTSAWPSGFRVLMNGIVTPIKDQGYIVTPIKNQVLMLQVRSSACKNCCVFVFLGNGDHKTWESEAEICYMLSRLRRTWKAIWLFDAIARPDGCLAEMKTFLEEKKVTPAQGGFRRNAEEKRRAAEVSKIAPARASPASVAVWVCPCLRGSARRARTRA